MRVSLRTRKLRRQRIGWIGVGILEEARLQFGIKSLWGEKQESLRLLTVSGSVGGEIKNMRNSERSSFQSRGAVSNI